MREGRWMVGGALTLVLVAGTIDSALGAELCTKRSGAVVRREVACKKSETVMNLNEFGPVGPTGPMGPTGPSGLDGMAGVTGATGMDGAPGMPATSLWAVVASDGTLARGSAGTTSMALLGAGQYEVAFNRDVTGCAYLATNGLTGSSGAPPSGEVGVVGRSANANAVFVMARDGAGTAAALGFHLAVFCP